MLDRLKRFAAGLIGDDSAVFDAQDYRLAAAALLAHVAAVDGTIADSERTRLLGLVQNGFGLDDHSANRLIAAAIQRDRESPDIADFVDVLRRKLDAHGRRRILDMMRDTAGADGHIHEFEESLHWRVAQLLDVKTDTEQ